MRMASLTVIGLLGLTLAGTAWGAYTCSLIPCGSTCGGTAFRDCGAVSGGCYAWTSGNACNTTIARGPCAPPYSNSCPSPTCVVYSSSYYYNQCVSTPNATKCDPSTCFDGAGCSATYLLDCTLTGGNTCSGGYYLCNWSGYAPDECHGPNVSCP